MNPARRLILWLELVDPGTHRRIKGLRLVTAYAIASMAGSLPQLAAGLPDADVLGTVAADFALWASVSEGQSTRAASSRDLVLLVLAAALGALAVAWLAGPLSALGRGGAELTLVSGAFCVGYLRRFGILGTGLGSQLYIGQLVAYEAALRPRDTGLILLAGVVAAVASVVPRVLSGPAEHPALAPSVAAPPSPWLRMGLQTAIAALVIVLLNGSFGLVKSSWAITACTYVIASTTSATIDRVRRRLIGTAIGVPLGIVCLPLAAHAAPLVWLAAALAMVIYAMALPERYDIACGAFAFALIVTLAASGDTALSTLISRGWETLLGGALGLAMALLLPLRLGDPGDGPAGGSRIGRAG
jgi:hypothetical protein